MAVVSDHPRLGTRTGMERLHAGEKIVARKDDLFFDGMSNRLIVGFEATMDTKQDATGLLGHRSRSLGSARSRSEITRFVTFGQTMARSGSSQRTPRAASGR